MNFKPGDKARIERDEVKYPPKGTWFTNRGRVGTVVEVNRGAGGPVEYGVTFGTPPSPDPKTGSISAGVQKTWFRKWEIVPAGTRKKETTA